MKTKRRFLFRGLFKAVPLFIVANLNAAPLAWFRGPPLIEPTSGAATTADGGRGNVLIGGAASGYFPFPIGLVATNNSWTVLAPLSGLIIAPGVAGSGDPILVYGGSNGSNSTSAVINYSPSGDTVSAVPSMNAARSYLGYATGRSGNAYALGGLDENGAALASAERVNSDSAWNFIASLPAALYNFPAVFDGTNRIYVFGGDTSSGTETNGVLFYSVNANTWTAVASMPMAVAGSGAARGVDGKFYVVGGVSGGVTVNVVQVYDPASNSWAISTPLPQDLSATAMGVDSLGRLIVMGGADTNGLAVNNVWRSQQLGLPDSPPGFTQFPATNGTYLEPYSSSIVATGAPPPVYLLINGPSAMTVDYFSGAITWTPDISGIGTNSVTVRATNYAGSVDYTFNIVVPNSKPNLPTNLTVSSVTDTSAVLSWSPEPAWAGAVTYTLGIPHPYHSPRGSGGGVNWQIVATGIPTNVITLSGYAPLSSTTYGVEAVGPGGTSAWSSWVAVQTTGPEGPTSLFITDLTSTSISLAWSPSPGPAQNPRFSPIVSYNVMEHIYSPLSNVPVRTGISGTNATLTGLAPGSAHLWYISGVDTAGNGSPLGSVYLVVTVPLPSPARVSQGLLSNGNFQFNVQEGGSVVQTVLLEANTDLTDSNGWVQIGSVLPGTSALTFIDTNASLYPTRFYRVRSP